MGYTTDFTGCFKLDRPLDPATLMFLHRLSTSRRMTRDVSKLPPTGFEKYGFTSWGEQGELYVDGGGWMGQDQEPSILDYNAPPSTQPGLWCYWIPVTDVGEWQDTDEPRTAIAWNQWEKFYEYVPWIKWIITKVLQPRGYTLNGAVHWYGEDRTDVGVIEIVDNVVRVYEGYRQMADFERRSGVSSRELRDTIADVLIQSLAPDSDVVRVTHGSVIVTVSRDANDVVAVEVYDDARFVGSVDLGCTEIAQP